MPNDFLVKIVELLSSFSSFTLNQKFIYPPLRSLFIIVFIDLRNLPPQLVLIEKGYWSVFQGTHVRVFACVYVEHPKMALILGISAHSPNTFKWDSESQSFIKSCAVQL